MKTNDLKWLAPAAESARRASVATDRLREVAAREGLIDVALGSVDSPVGELLVAVTHRGLAAVAFDDDYRETVLERLGRQVSPRVLRSVRETEQARRELEEYFEGRRTRFDLRLDRRLMHPFAREVLDATARVRFGALATYGEIANRIGRPSAARAVGAALGSNPIPIVVPCHRVVGAGGKLTGYAGGLDRKRTLLALEGALAPRLDL
jgi:methylated-DNA-[protein]-cysteine S-methyltransferase